MDEEEEEEEEKRVVNSNMPLSPTYTRPSVAQYICPGVSAHDACAGKFLLYIKM